MTLDFCLVGIGKHSDKKIIPSIIKSKNNLKYVVTSQRKKTIDGIIIFNTLDQALKKVSKNTIFILSTPPKIHQKQALKILKNNFNIIIEKPSFLSSASLIKCINLKKKNNKFIYENFMYRHSYAFHIISSFIKNFSDEIISININFLLPSYPSNSFRTNSNYVVSTIYDIGCYITSFTVFSKININSIKLLKNFYQKRTIYSSLFELHHEKFDIKAHIGRDKIYKNNISILLNNNFKVVMEYFFFGTIKKKYYKIYFNNKLLKKINFNDFNQFNYTFNQSRGFFKKNQLSNTDNLKQLKMLKKMEYLYNKCLIT